MLENLSDLISATARRLPEAEALRFRNSSLNYGELDAAVSDFASAMLALGLERSDRIAVLSDKQISTVVAAFGTMRAGCVFVPVNPLAKPDQVAYILANCNVRVLVTTSARLAELAPALADCPDLTSVVLQDDSVPDLALQVPVRTWQAAHSDATTRRSPFRVISSDMASILYTSGSTGKPKGVVLSHLNMITGAQSVASYLENDQHDRILALLPLSFDAGFSQLTTAFSVGACVVLHNYLLPGDVIKLVRKERITGITGVPPLWMQLTQKDWPDDAGDTVRYFANTGGKMPKATLAKLRAVFRKASPFLMYGLTEAFRSTYLPPSEVDNRPDSIGKAVPNVEVLVVAEDGSLCGPDEPGELVHRGPLVSLGYWNDPERTAIRFKPVPELPAGLCREELAVWSGDTVRQDADGFLYFVGRRDEMIKTSGYRVSPTEVEEVVFASGAVSEVVAVGVPHPQLGQAIVLFAKAPDDAVEDSDKIIDWMKAKLPNYMQPADIHWRETLPRNPNGKLDRKTLLADLGDPYGASDEDSA